MKSYMCCVVVFGLFALGDENRGGFEQSVYVGKCVHVRPCVYTGKLAGGFLPHW